MHLRRLLLGREAHRSNRQAQRKTSSALRKGGKAQDAAMDARGRAGKFSGSVKTPPVRPALPTATARIQMFRNIASATEIGLDIHEHPYLGLCSRPPPPPPHETSRQQNRPRIWHDLRKRNRESYITGEFGVRREDVMALTAEWRAQTTHARLHSPPWKNSWA